MLKEFSNKAQSSFEYIALVGIITLFVVAGVGVIYTYSQRSTDDVGYATIEKIGRDVIDVSEKIYYVGGDSWETIRFNLPENVKKMYILNNYELVIEYESFGGNSHAVFFSDINLTTPYSNAGISNISNAFHAGLNVIRISSTGSAIKIEEIT